MGPPLTLKLDFLDASVGFSEIALAGEGPWAMLEGCVRNVSLPSALLIVSTGEFPIITTIRIGTHGSRHCHERVQRMKSGGLACNSNLVRHACSVANHA